MTLLIVLLITMFNFFVGPLDGKMYQLLKKPKKIEVKGIYWTGYTAGWDERREELIDLVDQTELNSVVIDMKDSTGKVFFDTNVLLADQIGAEDVMVSDIKKLLQELKSKDIYTVARLALFQDPFLAEKRPDLALKQKSGGLWRDFKGLAWVDTMSQEVWKYNLDIVKEVIALGFDEINFDYIRFPSDGNLEQIVYPFYEEKKSKADSLKRFFQYVDKELAFYPIYTSIDLFGMVLVKDDGLGIGQRFQDAAMYFDYIAPMVYPSHYPRGFEGFENPALYPYEVIHFSLNKAKNDIIGKRAEFRPWIQDFDLGADYTEKLVRDQIRAVYDSGLEGWMLWNSSNQYTEEALEKTEILGDEIPGG